MNQPDPQKMAEHLKELGPDKVAAAICAAFAALAPLCAKAAGTPEQGPAAPPKSMRDAADSVGNAMAPKESPWT